MGFFSNLLTGGAAGPIIGLIEKLIPDKGAQDAAKLKLLELQQNGELAELDADMKLSLGQLDVNKAEAQSGNWYASSWRPSAGYVCVIGLAYQFLVQPILAWVSGIHGWALPPALMIGDLMTLLGGMLGLSGMRTSEKFKGVAS